MKILYLHGNSYSEQQANNLQVFNMCQAFSELGIEVILCIPESHNEDANPFEYISQQLGYPPLFQIETYKKFVFAGRFQMLGNYFGAKALLKKMDAELCFVRDPLLLKIAFDAHLPILFEVHNAEFHHRNQFLNNRWENYVLKIARKRQLLKFITISEALKRFWENKGIPQKKMLVAHDGFSVNLFKKEINKNNARSILGLELYKKIVVYVGSLYADRGIERIITLAKCFPEVLFVAVGGNEDQKEYYQKLSKSAAVNNILWKGFVPHSIVPTYLFAADVLLLLFTWNVPTINFCSPLKTFEYMAAGRIIVGEAYPTITEILHHNFSALLARPDDFEDLCENLEKALNGIQAPIIARQAQEHAFKKYTWQNRARRILISVEDESEKELYVS